MENINVANLNAAAFLRERKEYQAIITLRTALRSLQDGVNSELFLQQLETKVDQPRITCLALEEEGSHEFIELSPHSAVPLFNRCFALNGNYSCEALSGIVMFNLGLAYHRYGLKHGTPKILNESFKLYKMSYHLLHNESSCDHADCCNLDVALLAIVSNMAHVKAHTCEINDVGTLLCLFDKILCGVDPSAFERDVDGLYSFFYLTSHCCKECAAPAA